MGQLTHTHRLEAVFSDLSAMRHNGAMSQMTGYPRAYRLDHVVQETPSDRIYRILKFGPLGVNVGIVTTGRGFDPAGVVEGHRVAGTRTYLGATHTDST